jgi:hypothetical protein
MKPHLIALTVLLVSLLTFGAAIYFFYSNLSFLSEAEQADGTVIELVRSGKSYYPIVSYTDHAGNTHQFRSTAGASPPAYDVGEAVTVFFLGEQPEDAILGGFFSLWFKSLALGLVGILTFFAGRDLLRKAIQSKKDQQSV